MIDIDKYKEVEDSMLNFLDFFSFNMCHCKSMSSELPQKTERYWSHPTQRELCSHVDMPGYASHHQGLLADSIKLKNNISSKYFQDYIENLEHGLFHGFCTAFIGMWHKLGGNDSFKIPAEWYHSLGRVPKQKKLFPSKFLASCLLHDFGRFVKQSKRHDVLSSEHFNLLNIVANHSVCDDTNSLVTANRIELQRYKNYKSWIETDKLNIFNDNIEIFYKYIRPALKQIFQHRKSVWIKHGPEYDEYLSTLENIKDVHNYFISECNKNAAYPPKGHWPATQDGKGYSIDVDRFPSYFCFTHGLIGNYIPHGFIPLDLFKEKGGTITQCCSDNKIIGMSNELQDEKGMYRRDHLAAISNIPIKNWIFFIDKVKTRRKAPVFECTLKILESSLGVCSFKLANSFIQTINYFIDFFTILNINCISEESPQYKTKQGV
jgi:hypothetical protein